MSTKARLRRSPSPLLLLVLAMGLCAGSGLPAQAGVGRWTPLGPMVSYSNDIGLIAVHPGAPGALWASLPQGGLYRSRDRGTTWRWVGQPFTGSGVGAVAADPSRPGALWAATSLGVFRTEDAGNRWVRLTGESYTVALGESHPDAVVAVPGSLYVVTYRRLIASRDGGRTWEILYDMGETGRIQAFATHPAAPTRHYLAIHGPEYPDLLRSVDSGQTWELLPMPFPDARIDRLGVTAAAVYASDSGAEGGLFRSTDGGRTWQEVVTGRPGAPFAVRSWTLDPRSPQTLYIYGPAGEAAYSEHALWVSRNAGRTWRKLGRPQIFPGSIVIDSAAGALYVTDSKQLARSLDGGLTWKIVFRAPDTESSCAQVAFQPDDPSRMALAVGFTLYTSRNGGWSWGWPSALRNVWDVRDVDIDPEDPSWMVAVSGSSGLLTQDGGRTWQRTSGAYDLSYIESLVRADGQTLFAAGLGIYRSTDNGQSWQTALPGWTPWSENGRWAQKLEVDPADPSKVYALTFLIEVVEPPHDPLADYPSALWKSEDGGGTWRKVALNLRTFAFDRSRSRLYAVRNRDILASDDRGTTWEAVARTPHLVHDLVIDPADPDVFYIAGDGVWRSADRGITWKRLGQPIEAYSLTLHPTDPRTLYAAQRWGVFEITIPERLE
ncbi:MAG TPA: hypothetical protein VF756_08350 [Thermoanaerobaculia bacterium]